jgi:C4-dicarboxylate transporter DctM subunit
MVIMAAAALFAWVMVYVKIPQTILATMMGLSTNKFVILLIINVVILIAGMFMESGAIQYIAVPILLPVVTALGIDPVHFGIFFVVNLAIGMMTPPFGITLFTAARVFKTSIQEISRESVPYLISLIFSLMLITYFPQLVMWIL